MIPRIVWLCVVLPALAAMAAAPAGSAFGAEAETHEGLVVSAGAGKLAMTGTDGQQHAYDISDKVKITVNGRMGRLEDLKAGTRIRVTTDKAGRALNVATVDAVKTPFALATVGVDQPPE